MMPNPTSKRNKGKGNCKMEFRLLYPAGMVHSRRSEDENTGHERFKVAGIDLDPIERFPP